ncbi:hypothetical protein Tco_0506364 [Tanacetum coccineum]
MENTASGSDAFTSPFGVAMVLLGENPEPEVEAVIKSDLRTPWCWWTSPPTPPPIELLELLMRRIVDTVSCDIVMINVASVAGQFCSATSDMKCWGGELVLTLETMACASWY